MIDLGKYANLSEIGESAFGNCINVETVIIFNTVDYIYLNAFSGCDSVKEFYFGGSEEDWEIYNDDDLTNKEFYMNNSAVSNANVIRYYYYDQNTVINSKLNYWYYDTDGNIVVYQAQ